MTSKIIVIAESHDCEVRQIPVVNGTPLGWDSLSEETQRFQQHTIAVGESREFHVHQNMSLAIREILMPPKETP